MLTDYMTYDEIRGLLGVEALELPNAVLMGEVYLIQLEQALEDIYSELPAYYAGLVERKKAHDEDQTNPNLTPEERKLVGSVKVFAVYKVAHILASSQPAFAPKSMDDGKAGRDRVTDPFTELKADLAGTVASMRARILGLLEDLVNLVPAPLPVYTGMVAVPLGVDPVTNA